MLLPQGILRIAKQDMGGVVDMRLYKPNIESPPYVLRRTRNNVDDVNAFYEGNSIQSRRSLLMPVEDKGCLGT